MAQGLVGSGLAEVWRPEGEGQSSSEPGGSHGGGRWGSCSVESALDFTSCACSCVIRDHSSMEKRRKRKNGGSDLQLL